MTDVIVVLGCHRFAADTVHPNLYLLAWTAPPQMVNYASRENTLSSLLGDECPPNSGIVGVCVYVCICWGISVLKVVGVLLLLYCIFPVLSLIGSIYCTYWNGDNHGIEKYFVCAGCGWGNSCCFSLLGFINVKLEHAKNAFTHHSVCHWSGVRGGDRKWAFSTTYKCQQWV